MNPVKPLLFVHLLKKIYNHPSNADNRIAPISRFFLWQANKRLLRRTINISVFNGATWICEPKSTAAGELLYANNGICDFNEMNFIARYLQPGDSFLDVGANAGIYTVFASNLVGPSGMVQAFEPDEVAFKQLTNNVELNQFEHVTLYQKAVGEEAGLLYLTSGKDTTNHLVPSNTPDDSAIAVESICLDDLFTSTDFTMGKIDIEGAEPWAFRGANSMFQQRNPPVWLIEINGLLRRFGFTETELVQWLFERNYLLAIFDAKNHQIILDQECWRERSNVLAIAADRLDFVRTRLNNDSTEREIKVLTR